MTRLAPTDERGFVLGLVVLMLFAIAVADAALAAGRHAVMVIAHDAESPEDFRRGRFHLFHVAVEVDGILCDGRGRIYADDEILSFMESPIPASRIQRFEIDSDLKTMIRRKTRWTVSFEKYADEAEKLVRELG